MTSLADQLRVAFQVTAVSQQVPAEIEALLARVGEMERALESIRDGENMARMLRMQFTGYAIGLAAAALTPPGAQRETPEEGA